MKKVLFISLSLVIGASFAFGQRPVTLAQRATAKEVNRAMGMGFNLGNAFDVGLQPTTFAGNKGFIDLYRAAGMKHIRIPITWMDGFNGDHLAGPDGTIRQNHPRLRELKKTVDYALSQGLIVVINSHHEHWLKKSYDDSPAFDGRFARLWTGIATTFRNAPKGLVFETLNEPEGKFGQWGGDPAPQSEIALRRTRHINEVAYRAIRATGGNNATRVVMVGVNGLGNQGMFEPVYPTRASLPGGGRDRNLMVTLHTYDPWNFCGQDGLNRNYPGDSVILAGIERAGAHANKLQVPVNYGEFGVGRDRNPEERNSDVVRNYYRVMRLALERQGFSGTVWDDRGWFGLTEPASSGFQFVHGIVPHMMKR
ncbi:MAG: glycoside hydrolase family 5 protein [Fimbriimonadaceae bacterium]|nr:glycoside hydrolase family 5 protein [Fimbriimonadaceae bacterium]